MTDDTAPTLTHEATFWLTAFAAYRDGTAGGDVLDLSVTVEFVPDDDLGTSREPDQVLEQIDGWLNLYMRSRNLTDVFDFPPTPANIAIWVARICEQFAGERFAAVTVGLTRGEACAYDRDATVRYRGHTR